MSEAEHILNEELEKWKAIEPQTEETASEIKEIQSKFKQIEENSKVKIQITALMGICPQTEKIESQIEELKTKIIFKAELDDWDEQYVFVPKDIMAIYSNFDYDIDPYEACRKVVENLERIGWTTDYGLCGETYDLEKVYP